MLTIAKTTIAKGVKKRLTTVKSRISKGLTIAKGYCCKIVFTIVEHTDFIENNYSFDDCKNLPLKGETIFYNRPPIGFIWADERDEQNI